uniref:Uncharacterized protein n=1 Tax=Ditylenchus dipsaci TaxID=166011 RepID=A0A915ED60_9BILA
MDLMSEALCKCECLTYLCANDARFGDQGSDASLIRRALNEIFGEGTVPTVSDWIVKLIRGPSFLIHGSSFLIRGPSFTNRGQIFQRKAFLSTGCFLFNLMANHGTFSRLAKLYTVHS